jgi:hypothetical protein
MDKIQDPSDSEYRAVFLKVGVAPTIFYANYNVPFTNSNKSVF